MSLAAYEWFGMTVMNVPSLRGLEGVKEPLRPGLGSQQPGRARDVRIYFFGKRALI